MVLDGDSTPAPPIKKKQAIENPGCALFFCYNFMGGAGVGSAGCSEPYKKKQLHPGKSADHDPAPKICGLLSRNGLYNSNKDTVVCGLCLFFPKFGVIPLKHFFIQNVHLAVVFSNFRSPRMASSVFPM